MSKNNWRRRTNDKVQELCKEQRLTAVVIAEKIRWLWHVQKP